MAIPINLEKSTKNRKQIEKSSNFCKFSGRFTNLHQFVPDLSRACPGPVPGLSRACPGPVPGLSRACPGAVPGLSRGCPGPVPGLSRACPGPVPGLSRACPGPVPGLSRACPGPVPGLSRACPGAVPGLSRACPRLRADPTRLQIRLVPPFCRPNDGKTIWVLRCRPMEVPASEMSILLGRHKAL